MSRGVLAAADVGAREGPLCSADRHPEPFPRGLGERHGNRGLPRPRYVVPAGAVAALTAGVFGLFAGRRDAFCNGIPEKGSVNVGMARPADITADVIAPDIRAGQTNNKKPRPPARYPP